MRKPRHCRSIISLAVTFLVTAGFAGKPALGETSANHTSANFAPTPAAGESWLSHLHRPFDETSMGKTGQLGPLTPEPELARWEMGSAPAAANQTVTLHGADLYRMNCRGCHGESGQGAPPEINSVINPVRGTSATAVMERMKAVGMDMSRADAVKLAQQSKGMLLDRLHHGGQNMPAFPHLREAEVSSLLAYLRELAGVPGAQAEQIAVREPRVQVGEHIVKSTCHICHSAAGPNPTPDQLYEGAIPPLNTLASRTTRAQFIRKVTHGAPIFMGAPPQFFRGRMPVFYYLTEEEAADVYLYLTRYPPYQWAALDPNPILTSAAPDSGPVDATPQVGRTAFLADAGDSETRPATAAAHTDFSALPVLAGLGAAILLGLGLGLTLFELKRLSAAARSGIANASRAAEIPGLGDELLETGNSLGDCEYVA